jgi:hypothetical protein
VWFLGIWTPDYRCWVLSRLSCCFVGGDCSHLLVYFYDVDGLERLASQNEVEEGGLHARCQDLWWKLRK